MPLPTLLGATPSEHSREAGLEKEAGREDIARLLETPESLETYLEDVKQRREANRQQRRRAYWQAAVERLRDELRAAQNEQDAEIADELKAVLRVFEDALAAASPAAVNPALPDGAPPPREQAADECVPVIAVVVVEPIIAEPVIVEPIIVDEAARQSLVAAAEELQERIVAHLAVIGDNLPYEIRLRALFCEGQALIHDPNLPGGEQQHLIDLLDDLAPDRTHRVGDCPFALTERSPQMWNMLRHLYDACAAASESLDWYWENEQYLSEESRVDLLNAVSAAQQQLYRHIEGLRRRDEAVLDLYRQIREAGQTTGFLRALSSEMTEEELSELATRREQILRDAQREVEEQRAQAERGWRKEAAVAAVIAWNEALEGRGVTSESLDMDRERLCGFLEECLSAGVPPTNVKIRAAILDTAPVLLAGQARYAKFLDAVLAERARRGLDAVEVVPPQAEIRDETLDLLVKSVAEFIRGKRIVMLGGKSRPQVAQELGSRLECEANWLDSDTGDKFAKFSSAVKKADVVLLLKNFASHELFHGSKDAMAANGKHFVVLPSGYGVKQVISQLSQYVAKEKASA